MDLCNRLGLILPLHQSGENKDKIFSIQSDDDQMFVVSYFSSSAIVAYYDPKIGPIKFKFIFMCRLYLIN